MGGWVGVCAMHVDGVITAHPLRVGRTRALAARRHLHHPRLAHGAGYSSSAEPHRPTHLPRSNPMCCASTRCFARLTRRRPTARIDKRCASGEATATECLPSADQTNPPQRTTCANLRPRCCVELPHVAFGAAVGEDAEPRPFRKSFLGQIPFGNCTLPRNALSGVRHAVLPVGPADL